MRQQDWQKFRELMDYAEGATNTYGKNIDNAATVLFAELARYPLAAVADAVRRHCRTEPDFPVLAEIIRAIEGRVEDRAALAWAQVFGVAQKVGGERSARFPDPVTHWAITRMGGWERLGWRVKNDGAWLKRDFEQYYRLGADQGVTWADVPPVLEGAFTRNVYDAAEGRSFPANELPALAAPAKTQAAEIIRLVARNMEAAR